MLGSGPDRLPAPGPSYVREGELREYLKSVDARQMGMVDFNGSLVELVEKEMIHVRVAMEATPNRDELTMRLKKLERSLAIFEKVGGLDSADVAPTLNNLAALYQRLGRLGDAEPLFRRTLAIRERTLGSSHPDTGQSLNNLATLYEKLGRHGDSEPLFRRALVIYEKTGGPEHLAVATLLNNLGQVAKVTGRYAEAEPLIRRSLAIREKVLGADHPDVSRSLNNWIWVTFTRSNPAADVQHKLGGG